MDRQQMINKLEQIKAGNQVPLEDNVSLHAKNGKVYRGAEEVPLENLSMYKNAVRIMIVEGKNPELVKIIEKEVCPELIIVESRINKKL